MFDKVLIANRGEIAVRVIRACRDLDVATVAVYSDADAGAPHTRLADAAVRLGPAPAAESYLDQEAVIEAARDQGADAIHPGYGFLSENADFAEAVGRTNLKFIGPSPDAMRALGDKVNARQTAIANDVPVSPGSEGAIADPEEAKRVAEDVGYPLMIKAAAGGGGIGMRIVHGPDELESKLEAAQRQAQSAFGVPDVFVERYLTHPRHIEIQIIGDEHGTVVHLGERECSIQRRYQKLIEEAPSPALTPEVRADIGARAVKLAEATGYYNAGTLEFLYQDGDFHFNEVNTRLQVEHPTTELVTGLDLVKEQIRVAAGEPLSFSQDDVTWTGHAIECRINAEDPHHGFRPSPGHLDAYEAPGGPGVRVDDGVRAGFTVPGDYDSLVAKLVTWGRDRTEAVERMRRALREYRIQGFVTNIPFHQRVLRDEAFLAGDLSTRYLEERPVIQELEQEAAERDEAARLRAAAVAAALTRAPGGGVRGIVHRQTTKRVDDGGGRQSAWVRMGRARGRGRR